MVLERAGEPLVPKDLPEPVPGPGEVLLEVLACGICRTDLHVVDGELTRPRLPLVPGHQVVGRIRAWGPGVTGLSVGDRVGVPWLGWTCGTCPACLRGRENLCPAARFTGYDRDGGFAERCVADTRYCFPIPAGYPDRQAAPLLCAGLIGYRALSMAGDATRLGLYGFGAAAHIVIQLARHQGRRVFAFTRAATSPLSALPARWGRSGRARVRMRRPSRSTPRCCSRPSGRSWPLALQAIVPGGTVVCAGIHMSDIPSFPYASLWGERRIVSVANLTRRDGEEFLALAPKVPVRTEVTVFPLAAANDALAALRDGRLVGAGVLEP